MEGADLAVDEFEERAMAYASPLYGAALKMVRNASDAEDLVQETYLRAFRARHTFEAGTNLKAWLFKILINLTRSAAQKAKRTPSTVPSEGVEDFSLYQALLRSDPQQFRSAERIALDALVDGEVKEALAALPIKHREAVLLSDVEGFSYKEMAQILGIPIGTVMSRLHRGRKALQKSLWEMAVQRGIVKDGVVSDK